MDYVIGMDGGGTKTRAKIADMYGNVLGTFDGESSNINSLSIDKVSANIISLISSSVKKLRLQPSCCKGICIGSAGMGREEDRAILKEIIEKLFQADVIIVDDAIIMSSACENVGDIILIAGTGSICYGLNSDKSFCRIGGWGHIIGDEAGAYDIAVNILKAVMHAYDGRGEKTILTELVLKYLKIDKEQDLIPYVYRAGNGKKEIAGIARLLSDGCLLGDYVSVSIAEKSAELLVEMVEAMHIRLTLEDKVIPKDKLISTDMLAPKDTLESKDMLASKDTNKKIESFSIILNGSVIKNNIYIRQRFERTLLEKYPLVDIRDYEQDAADGALRLIINYINVSVSH